jgi:hypothetical protein
MVELLFLCNDHEELIDYLINPQHLPLGFGHSIKVNFLISLVFQNCMDNSSNQDSLSVPHWLIRQLNSRCAELGLFNPPSSSSYLSSSSSRHPLLWQWAQLSQLDATSNAKSKLWALVEWQKKYTSRLAQYVSAIYCIDLTNNFEFSFLFSFHFGFVDQIKVNLNQCVNGYQN